MGRHKEIKIIATECIFCKETVFPQKIDINVIDIGDNIYKCPKCGSFLELEEEEKIVIFEPKMDLDPTIH
jgi:DNA-directed RNA polymerase subunit RPC12/RpoP